MDKDVVPGCLGYIKWEQANVIDYFNGEEIDGLEQPNTIEEEFYFMKDKQDCNLFIRRCKNTVNIENRIIGHYDITAVLKYIENKTYKFEAREVSEFNPLASRFDGLGMDFKIAEKSILIYSIEKTIPNKPLHLYTEEEDKDLLELLKTLCPTNK